MDLRDRLLRSAIATAAAVVAGLLTRSMVKAVSAPEPRAAVVAAVT